MKLLKKTLGITLLFVMGLSLFGCDKLTLAKKPDLFSTENLIKAAEDRDYEEYEDSQIFLKQVSDMVKDGHGYYVAEDEEEAQYFYDVLINRLGTFDDYDVVDFTIVSAGDDAQEYFFLVTFEDEDDAEDFYDECCDRTTDEDSTDDYEYAWSSIWTTKNKNQRMNAYFWSGDKVLYSIAIGSDLKDYLDMIEEFGLEKIEPTFDEEE